MQLHLNTSIPVFTVFLQGLLSFFSPCVLPLLPLYISYFSGGAKSVDENGNIIYPKGKIFFHTLCFVLGISLTFFILGFGFTALGKFFSTNQLLFSRISGIIMILFGLYQFGIFGKDKALETERRFNLDLSKWGAGPLSAFLLGFTFSFAWTPCIGPTMSSVLLMASSSSTSAKSVILIFVYVLGFVIPFLLTGMFTASVLSFFKKHQGIVKYTVKAGACLLVIMGIMTATGFMNGISSYLSSISTQQISENKEETTAESKEETKKAEETKEAKKSEASESKEESKKETGKAGSDESKENKKALTPAPDFTLVDQNGKTHKLSDYKGKTVFLNFWATWCPPCRAEMPDIQALYEKYNKNADELVVLGVAGPNLGNEQDIEGISAFLKENSYDYPVVMDETGVLFTQYGIRAYPTTFMIDVNGNIFGYVTGSLNAHAIESIVTQTMDSVK